MASAELHFSVLFLCLTFKFSCGFIGSGDNFRRKVSLELNPGLNASATPLPPGVDLLHVRAQGINDTLHFLLCSHGAPTLLLVHTNSTVSRVQVDWPAFLARNTTGSLKVEPEGSVVHSSAVVFIRLWEYDDVNDTADPDSVPRSSFLSPYELQNFTWSDMASTLDPVARTATLCGGDGTSSFTNGTICFKVSAFEGEGREQSWPSLLHNANSSQIKVWLSGVAPRANHSRFSLELQAVGGASVMDRVDILRSIDDEYTPSIFKVSQWVASPPNQTSPVLSYVQWKPVAYRRPSPAFEDSTPCHHSVPVPVPRPEQPAASSGLVWAFYGTEPLATGVNITFSIAGDPFYSVTNFLSWTVLVGLGTPPVDSFSPLVLSIMAVGLGTPMIILILGGVYVCLRKRDTPLPPVYERIN